ncbi:MAG: hypothetical protein KIT69_11725, partial [Propionibacteriaceae bacterium]|nr:hypothetical protein [Propionibacteriaceae bacterium]
ILMNLLRYLLYNIPYIDDKKRREDEKILYRNTDYISWKSYLDINKKDIFKLLLPEYEAKYKQYNNIFSMVLTNILNHIKDNKNQLSEYEQIIYDDIFKDILGNNDKLKTIKDNNSLTDSTKKDILKDLLLKSEYALQFYNIYSNTNNLL